MANEIKLNTIKFLMSMFEQSCASSTQIRVYKSQVEELVRRNQISPAVQRLIYGLYGIQNTDTYKPTVQQNKLMQVNWLMITGERAFVNNTLKDFKISIEDGLKTGAILKSARDFIYEAFDLDTDIGTDKAENRQKREDLNIKVSEKPKVEKSKEVLADIAKFKKEYLEDIYYEYDNPGYTGCTGEVRTLHRSLSSAIEKPPGAILVYETRTGDACHPSYKYVKVPIEAYKVSPVKTTIPNVSHRVNAPIGDPCHSGGFFRSNC